MTLVHILCPSYRRGKSSTCVTSLFKPAVSLQPIQLAVCPDEVKDKQAWLLQNVRGADGLLCMLSDKVTEEVIEAGKCTCLNELCVSQGF